MADSMIALGLIETRGLVGAIEAADAMCEAAKVTLLDPAVVLTDSQLTIRAPTTAGAAFELYLGAAPALGTSVVVGTWIIGTSVRGIFVPLLVGRKPS